jgi:tetratricopeptide (TPR) repeat protein
VQAFRLLTLTTQVFIWIHTLQNTHAHRQGLLKQRSQNDASIRLWLPVVTATCMAAVICGWYFLATSTSNSSQSAPADAENIRLARPKISRPPLTTPEPQQSVTSQHTPLSPQQPLQNGFEFLSKRQFDLAEEQFRQVLSSDPDNINALQGMLAVERTGRTNIEATITYLERLVALSPNNVVVVADLMDMYRRTQRTAELEELTHLSKDMMERTAFFEKQRAAQLINSGQFENATAYLQSVAETASEDSRRTAIYEELGDLAKATGKAEQALSYYKKAEAFCSNADHCNTLRAQIERLAATRAPL